MNARTFIRPLVLLLILFVMIYVGSENTQQIDFHFPLLPDKPVRASGAVTYLAVFAVGVLGSNLLHAGRSGDGDGEPRDEAGKKG